MILVQCSVCDYEYSKDDWDYGIEMPEGLHRNLGLS